MTFTLWFYGVDGEFEYKYGTFDHVAPAFRVPRLRGYDWEFDGDGWSTVNWVPFPEAGKMGKWYITWDD